MIVFENPKQIRDRADQIAQAETLQQVMELSRISVRWKEDDDCECVRVAYAKFREVVAQRIEDLLEQEVDRVIPPSSRNPVATSNAIERLVNMGLARHIFTTLKRAFGRLAVAT